MLLLRAWTLITPPPPSGPLASDLGCKLSESREVREAQQFSSDNTVAASDAEETVGGVEGEGKKNISNFLGKVLPFFLFFLFTTRMILDELKFQWF